MQSNSLPNNRLCYDEEKETNYWRRIFLLWGVNEVFWLYFYSMVTLQTRTVHGERAVSFTRLWNFLPVLFRSVQSIRSFLSQLRRSKCSNNLSCISCLSVIQTNILDIDLIMEWFWCAFGWCLMHQVLDKTGKIEVINYRALHETALILWLKKIKNIQHSLCWRVNIIRSILA